MNFDFDKVSKPKPKTVDPDWSNPVSFFYKLQHPEIKDLFPMQRDVLKSWFTEYKAGLNDKLVSLNTGGGKTLIGLMIAESIRRDSQGKVIYVCPNTFLGKQTIDEANKYGIPVSSYLKLSGDRPTWDGETSFLENNSICITTYQALLNPRSVFKGFEIKGIIFDDAHLSLDLLDEQFSLRINNFSIIKEVANIFKSSPSIKEKINSINENDPLALVMVPPIEWHAHADAIKKILASKSEVSDSFPWINLKEKFDRTFCFISPSRLEIGFLYPDIKNHFISKESIHRVYLSATMPNLDDITRVFGITPTRIDIENPDYRPQRLFVFSMKTKIKDSDDAIRKSLSSISKKNLVITPSNEIASLYSALGCITPINSDDVLNKINEFKSIDNGILVLANRYDGIDMPGETCHSLIIDGLPYPGTLKTRFFSEYFHNHQNSFLRSVLASKLVQAFGRTIRSNSDFSIIFLLGNKLNKWIINKDNRKFFKSDLNEDLEIGFNVSESISNLESLQSLSKEFLNQTDGWNNFFDNRKNSITPTEPLSNEEEIKNIQIARIERNINDFFISGKYAECLKEILGNQTVIAQYSKPVLGLYLSIASICCIETSNPRGGELSARAYGINPIFGKPIVIGDKNRSMQAQRIMDYSDAVPEFDWDIVGKAFDENLKKLGEVAGFTSNRPEQEERGTLDVCWCDEEKKIVIGFENKIDKINKVLEKKEADQCSGHLNWLNDNYQGYSIMLFVVGDVEKIHNLSSPGELLHIKILDISRVSNDIILAYSKKIFPEQLDLFLNEKNLTIDKLFPVNKVSNLKKATFC